jgi:glycosyltransferase involved in cell wall biosynthesis
MPDPRLTIGLVVRNGESHLAAALQSILNQTFRQFRLVICDNASTDETMRIATRFASRDPRIGIQRHVSDIGVVGNLLFAADHAETELFCWASHDDLREPRCLEALVRLLDEHPAAGLACCAVRNIDPDGARRDVRHETSSLRATMGMSAPHRLRMYLRDGAGTPFYGVFRTSALRESLHALRRAEHFQKSSNSSAPLLGIDMVFLADFIGRHEVSVTSEPLLLFRRGGISHQVDRYGSWREYLKHVVGFIRMLRRATSVPHHGLVARTIVALACWKYLTRFMLSKSMRCMTWHYVCKAIPVLTRVHARWTLARSPHIRQLSQRFHALHSPSRVVIFGAGKHTRRYLSTFQIMMRRNRHDIVAVCDDSPDRSQGVGGAPLITPESIGEHRPDIILVSSDAYEETLFRRAVDESQCAQVWTIYDRTLEANSRSSAASTDLTKRSMRASESSSDDDGDLERRDFLTTATNCSRA